MRLSRILGIGLLTMAAVAVVYAQATRIEQWSTQKVGHHTYVGIAAQAVSPTNMGRLYYDKTTNKLRLSENGGAYVNLAPAGGSIGGTGTAGKLAKFSAAQTIADSLLSESGTTMTLAGHLVFTDNTFDIGASGVTRPRTLYMGTSIVSPTVGPSATQQHILQAVASSTLAVYSNNLSVFAATTSAQLAGVISDETGTGLLAYATTLPAGTG